MLRFIVGTFILLILVGLVGAKYAPSSPPDNHISLDDCPGNPNEDDC